VSSCTYQQPDPPWVSGQYEDMVLEDVRDDYLRWTETRGGSMNVFIGFWADRNCSGWIIIMDASVKTVLTSTPF
jgi:hypothetical protein